jgi:Ca2+-binding EF-hand superfamily protein
MDGTTLTEDKIEVFKAAFFGFNTDANGAILIEELEVVMRSVEQGPTEDQLKEMMDEVDNNGNGTIEFPEFLAIMAR